MPTQKGVTEFELSAIDCCALWLAMYFESKKVEEMLLPLPHKKIKEIADGCLARLKWALANPAAEPYIFDITSQEGIVARAYVESEIRRLSDLVQEDQNMMLSCGHAVAAHLNALTELWELYPKEKMQ